MSERDLLKGFNFLQNTSPEKPTRRWAGTRCLLFSLKVTMQSSVASSKTVINKRLFQVTLIALDSEKETGCYKQAIDGDHQKGQKNSVHQPTRKLKVLRLNR